MNDECTAQRGGGCEAQPWSSHMCYKSKKRELMLALRN